MSHNISKQLIDSLGNAVTADELENISGGTSSLQTAYELSPNILTNSGDGAFTLVRGSSSDDDKVLRILNGLSAETFYVKGSGETFSNTSYVKDFLSVSTGQTQITTEIFLQLIKNDNSFRSIGVQNLSSGNLACGDFTAVRNDGNVNNNFASFGINSSGYNDPAYPIQTAGSGYAFVNGGTFVLGTQTAHDLIFHVGGTALTDRSLIIRGTSGEKGYVGFLEGTSSQPTLLGKIHIVNESDSLGTFYADRYSNIMNSPAITLRRARGTFASPSGLTTDDSLGVLAFRGYGISGFSTNARVTILGRASNNWTDTSQGTYITFSTTQSGTTNTTEKLRLWDNGRLELFNELSTRLGADNNSTGAINNVSTSGSSFIRFTNNTAPTINGFSDGYNGKELVIVNSGTGTLVIANNNVGSLAQNRIITGTNANINIPAGSSITLKYDSNAALWRISSGQPSFIGTPIVSTGTVNRLTFWSGTNTLGSSSTIFANDTSIHVGSTSAPANSGVFGVTTSITTTTGILRPFQILNTYSPATTATSNYSGDYVLLTLAGAGNVTTKLTVSEHSVIKTGTATHSDISVTTSNATINNATGGITSLILYDTRVTISAGTVTNSFGYYIPSSGMAGTNRWGVYIEDSTAFNYFANQTLFGTTTRITGATQINAIFNNGIKIGDSSNAASIVGGGGLRWNGTSVQFSNGVTWANLGGGVEILSATAAVAEAGSSWNANTNYGLTGLTVTGAEVGNVVLVNLSATFMSDIQSSAVGHGLTLNGWVSATNTVRVFARVGAFVNVPVGSQYLIRVIKS